MRDPWQLTTPPGKSEAHGDYMPPLLEALGLAELTHEARGNQMRAR